MSIRTASILMARQTLTVCALAGALAAAPVRSAVPEQEAVFSALRARVAESNRKYIGNESRRAITTHEYDARTGALISSSEALVHRKEYYHRKPVNTPIKYRKNGIELPPEEFKYRSRDPVHLPFDTTDGEQYRYRIIGRKTVEGRACHAIEIIPIKNTARHLRAVLYVTVDTIEPQYLEGTIADRPLGVSDIRVRLSFATVRGESIMRRGTYVIMLNIPMLYPHRRIVSSFVSSDERPIPKEN